MAKLLTKRKQAWVNQFKPKQVIGAPLNPNISAEQRYYDAMRKLVIKMTNTVDRELTKFFKADHSKEYFAQDASVSSQARILMNALIDKFDNLFAVNAKSLADVMMEEMSESSAVSLRGSLKELSGGLTLNTDILTGELNEIITASVNENVALIKSIPQQYLTGVNTAVMRSITTGNGLQDLVPFLRKHEGVTLRRARLIANDQTRKAYNNINKTRMQKLGIDEYKWLHSGGGKEPRKLHESYSGKIFSFDDPPIIDERTGQRGIPGQAINCFVGSTKVSLRNGCLHLWRYLHEGNIVNVTLSNGESFSCTPNHPILTQRGWLPANEIEHGDYLACSEGNCLGGINDKEADFVTTFDNLFGALNGGNAKITSPASQFNFHGDIPDNEVDGITASTNLAFNLEAMTRKNIAQFSLPLTNTERLLIELRSFSEVLHSSGAGGFRESNSLINGQSPHALFIGCTSIAHDDSVIGKNVANFLTTAPMDLRESKNACASIVRLDDGSGRIVDALHSGNNGDKIIEPNAQSFGNSSSTAIMQTCEFFEGLSFVKMFARVEKKNVSVFRGHVYTMESVDGWYGVTSANIISKNCRCRMVPVIKFDESDE